MIPNQIPVWEKNAEITLTIQEFETLMHCHELMMDTMSAVFNRLIEKGSLQMEYQDEQGNPISREEVEKIISNFQK